MLKKWLLYFSLTIASMNANALAIVAAENVYGDIAAQLGGRYVHVTSILNNPKQDPHLFSTSPKTAKAIASADLIIYNGLDYDTWMSNLIAANTNEKQVIIVAHLAHKSLGDNPHIWYDPTIMMTYATYLTATLSKLNPSHESYFQEQLRIFTQHYQVLQKQIAADKLIFNHAPVIATEPVFNDMANALGLTMHGLAFQRSVMNDTEPSAKDIKDFQYKLMHHEVDVLITNDQVIDPLTQRMQKIAEQAQIPCIGVSEIQPPGLTYFTWMHNQLVTLEKALGEKP